ncbi:PAS domain-containing sensor histidine kinase [Agrobacterium sp. fls2-241-TYG-188a]|uniref:sensor histidine kinase n=1 Tax=Agrobacterium sp. fls2-241-TYG-188a TaxID=3040275 RepID=UPI00254E59FE|nr:PAS domain-containing sensor histidine kinase [Agrobacterium sp. fls2-241-TYG-188a]
MSPLPEQIGLMDSKPSSPEALSRLLTAMGALVLEVDASSAMAVLTTLQKEGVSDLGNHLESHHDVTRQIMRDTTWAVQLADHAASGIGVLWPEESASSFIDLVVSSFLGGGEWRGECRMRHDNGSVYHAQLTSVIIHRSETDLRLLLALKDISAEKEEFDRLTASERRFRQLFDYMPIALTEVDASRLVDIFRSLREQGVEDLSSYIDANPGFMADVMNAMHVEEVNHYNVAMFGAESQEAMKGPITRYWQAGIATLRRSIEARYRGENFFQEEGQVCRMDGTVIDVLYAAARHGSSPDKSLVAFIDISDRKKAAEALRRSERRYQDLFQHVPVPVLQVNASGLLALLAELKEQGVDDLEAYIAGNPQFLWAAMQSTVIEEANYAAIKVLGVTNADELKGPITPLWRNHPEIYSRLLKHRYLDNTTYEEEVTITSYDGRTREGSLTVTFPPEMGDNGLTINAFVDTTDRKLAEQKLRQIEADYAHAARISMLGELTASIAHEVNQPLAAITTYGEAGLRWLGRPEPELSEVKEIVERIVADAQRAASVISRVRNLALRRATSEQVLPLDDVVAEALSFLKHECHTHQVRVTHLPALGRTDVVVDRTQLQQVVVNLTVNSIQAMASVSKNRRQISIQTVADGIKVRCIVDDSGPGIMDAEAENLFQSFVTTKENGMGMGLAICRSIVEAHGGHIHASADSALGGARFIFELPAAP